MDNIPGDLHHQLFAPGLLEIGRLDAMATGRQLERAVFLVPQMQTTTVDYRRTVDEEFAALFACQIEGVFFNI